MEKLCSVTGNPDPIVIWLKDGQVTDPTIPLMRGDEGNYTINAEGYSSITKELQVYVLCEYQI